MVRDERRICHDAVNRAVEPRHQPLTAFDIERPRLPRTGPEGHITLFEVIKFIAHCLVVRIKYGLLFPSRRSLFPADRSVMTQILYFME